MNTTQIANTVELAIGADVALDAKVEVALSVVRFTELNFIGGGSAAVAW